MWNPFRSPKVHAVLVKPVEPAAVAEPVAPEIETACLAALANRTRVAITADGIHERLARGALDKIRGREK